MYGAAVGWAAAAANEVPASSISHTCVIGGSALAFFVLFGVVEVGVLVSEPDVVVAALEASSALACLCLRRFLRGVASAVIAGGWTLAAVARAARAAAPRASEAISSGRLGLACEGVGAGPIAAPTATPIPSIAAASAAVTRAEGAWKCDFGFSGVLFIEWSGILVNQEHGPNLVGFRTLPIK